MFSETKYRKDIQVLRGLAVLAVVLFHANESYFPLGYLGVDVFFVISGFVVTPLILRIFTDQANMHARLSNLRHFYKRRFYRLAPALVVTLTISAISIFLLGLNGDISEFSKQGIATLLLAGNFGAYAYLGDYFSPNPNPLAHTWSLSVEEQIYIILPLILMLILHNRRSLRNITALVLTIITVISFISFQFPSLLNPVYSRVGISEPSLFSFYSPIDRIWQFTLGGLGYLLLNRYQSHKYEISKSFNFVAVIVVVIVLFGPIHMSQKVSSTLASLIALIVIVFKPLDVLPDLLFGAIEWLGDRSYSIYLVHMPLLYLAKYSPVTQIGNDENRNAQSAIAVFVSILLGALSHLKIENRFRNRGKNNHINLKNLTATLVLTSLVPLMLFLVIDRAQVGYQPDPNLPIPSKSLPWDWDSKCQIMNSKRPCVYGNQESTKSILLIGDSHAASNSQAIIEIARTNNIKVSVFTKAGCSFILNKKELSAKFKLPGLDMHCIAHNQAILDYINIHKTTITILSMRSPSNYILPNTASSRLLYRKNILSSLSKLRQSKTNVILIGSTPEYNSIKTRAQRFLGAKGQYSEIPLEDSRWWSNVAFANFHYLDTLEIFCSQSKCKNKVGSTWLFYDHHHLSKEGADMLVPELDPLVKEILSRNR